MLFHTSVCMCFHRCLNILCASFVYFYWLQLIQLPEMINCIGLWRIKAPNEGSENSVQPLSLPLLMMLSVFLSFSPCLSPPEVICTQAWSLEPSVTVVTRSRRPTRQRANATWSVKERRATSAEEPTDCPSIGWSWARSQHAAVSPTLCRKEKKNPPGLITSMCCATHTDTMW